ncbi:hypothetical protein ACHMW6_06460 [Pseudoduganella sp. UC29_106]|uniref:hypothetical protein n=1 Tax=Pseudoduganella sp. UC29_106 TaxID=3374553 RepID=UPI003756592E
MFQDITSEINKMVARDLSKELFGKGGGLSGIVDFASEIFGGKSKTPDAASAAVASAAKAAGAAPEVAASTAAAAALASLTTVTTAADSSLITLATTTIAVDTALTTLAASALTASVAMSAVAAKGASDGASGIFDLVKAAAASAKGNIFVGGGIIPFAKGGVPDIVKAPRYFPMAGGKTGLMGEAGPEAIMPLVRDHEGKLAVRMLGERGAIGTLQLGRDASGRLAVHAANDSSIQKFAVGGVFGGLSPNFKTNASSIQMPSTQSMSMTPGAGAERIAMVTGGASKQEINVNVPAGTSQASASQVGAVTARAIARSNRRNN